MNTTIREDILNDFKSYSKSLGLPMNVLLEAFMMQLVEDGFVLKFGKNNRITVDIDETKM